MRPATSNRLENEIREAVPKLLEMARELTWNRISDNCRFILSEIKNSELNAFEQIRLRKKENDRKTLGSLTDIECFLESIYDDLYPCCLKPMPRKRLQDELR